MQKAEQEAVVVAMLQTAWGRAQLHGAIQEAGAKAADHFPEGSLGEALGRWLAGLPLRGNA